MRPPHSPGCLLETHVCLRQQAPAIMSVRPSAGAARLVPGNRMQALGLEKRIVRCTLCGLGHPRDGDWANAEG